MRILLIGEYSRLHNSLKEGLIALGHEVILVSDGDGFKQYPSDISIKATSTTKKLPNILRQIIYRTIKFDIAAIERGIRFRKILKKLKGFDIVQLINEAPVKTTPGTEKNLLKKLMSQNGKTFLMCCSIDHTTLNYMINGKFRYSLIDPYLNDKSLKKFYRYILDYGTVSAKKLSNFIIGHCQGVIASDMDYVLPFEGHPKFLGLIPNPVNISKLPYTEAILKDKIIIFLGINRWNYHPKGIVYFEKALEIIKKKYGKQVEILTAESIAYNEYIKLYDKAHILLDQVYAYDQGYNALEAMAKGKVVFTGAEKEFYDYYELTERVAVNALPNIDSLVAELSYLIENPEEITAIGKRARAFIEREHSHIHVAAKYLEKWNESE